MDKQYAIFDLDGTLADSMEYWKALAAEFLESKGITQIPREILEKIESMTMRESSELFIQEFSLEGTPESIEEEMNCMMEKHYQKDIPLKKGVHDYLVSLHEKGVQMCVASVTAEHLMRSCLERLGVLQYFQFLLSCETVGAGKSRPDVYYEAARKLGSQPSETAVYEDALYAAETVKKAGFYTVGVYDESAAASWEKMIGLADECIYSFQK